MNYGIHTYSMKMNTEDNFEIIKKPRVFKPFERTKDRDKATNE